MAPQRVGEAQLSRKNNSNSNSNSTAFATRIRTTPGPRPARRHLNATPTPRSHPRSHNLTHGEPRIPAFGCFHQYYARFATRRAHALPQFSSKAKPEDEGRRNRGAVAATLSIDLFRLLVYVLSSYLQARVRLLSHQGSTSEDCRLFESSFPSGFDTRKQERKRRKHEYKLDDLDPNKTTAGGSPL